MLIEQVISGTQEAFIKDVMMLELYKRSKYKQSEYKLFSSHIHLAYFRYFISP